MSFDPSYTLYTGCMFSGKSSLLLRDVRRYRRMGKPVVVFKPKLDTRYADSSIVTHDGERLDAIQIGTGVELIECLAQSDETHTVVAVDEAFMIEGIAQTLNWLFMQGLTIVVSSLDLGSSVTPFAEITEMFPFATRVEKCTAVCAVCKGVAAYTYRKIDDESEILVGGDDEYEPRCRVHHPVFALQS